MKSVETGQSAIVVHVESTLSDLRNRIDAKAKRRLHLEDMYVLSSSFLTFDANDHLVFQSRLQLLDAELASLRRLYALALSYRDRYTSYATAGLGLAEGEHHGQD